MKSKAKRAPGKKIFGISKSAKTGRKAKQTSSRVFHSQKHDPTLGRYFQELAHHEVLNGETETIAAKEIAELEIELWTGILSEKMIISEIVEVIIDAIRSEYDGEDTKELVSFLESVSRRSTKPLKTKRSKTLYSNAVAKLVTALHDFDIKRELVTAAYQETVRLQRKKGLVRLNKQSGRLSAIIERVERAKHLFIQANLRLVVAIARRYDRGQMPLIDLIQEGNLGLIKAVDRFDYRRGFRFSTYASWWIRHAIGRALADKGHAVRIPVHALDEQHRLARASEIIGLRLGRAPTEDELAEEVGIDKRRLARARKHPIVPVCSLDREISGSDDRRYIDLLSDENCKSPFESTMLRAWTKDMKGVLGVLTEMEESIIRWRYGLDDGEEMTLKQIGDHFSLSRERIRQLQEQALRKIRRHLALDAA